MGKASNVFCREYDPSPRGFSMPFGSMSIMAGVRRTITDFFRRRSVVPLAGVLFLSAAIVASGSGSWQLRSPVAGTVLGVVVDVAAPGTILTDIDSSGLFVSTTGGRFWTQAAQPWSGAGGGVASNAGGIYAVSYYVTRSSDGIVWESFDFPSVATALAASMETSGRLLAGTLDGQIFGSEDGGQTWQRRFIAPGGQKATSIRFDPRSDSIVYAGFGAVGLWRSSDAGHSWTHIRGDLPLVLSVQALDVDARDSAVFLGTDKGVFKSLDGGTHWATSTGIPQGNVVSAIRSNEPVVVAGTAGVGLFESTDNGLSWNRVAAGPATVTALDVSPQGTFFAGGVDSGIVVRNSQGEWVSSSAGLFGTLAWFVQADKSDSDSVYAFLDHLAVSHDRGVTWSVSSGLDISSIQKFVVLDSERVVAIDGQWIFETEDGGGSWSQSLIPGGSNAIDLQLDSSTPRRILLLTNSDLLASSDFGKTWTSLSPPKGLAFTTYYTGLLVDPNRNGLFYLSEGLTGIFKTDDGGVTWTASNSGLPSSFNGSFALDSIGTSDSSVIFASSDGGSGGCPSDSLRMDDEVFSGYELFKSADRGATWSFVDPPPATGGAARIFIDPSNSNHLVAIAAGSCGIAPDDIFESTDSGAHWDLLDEWLARGHVWTISFSRDSKTLYAATRRGVMALQFGNGREGEIVVTPVPSPTPIIVRPNLAPAGAWGSSLADLTTTNTDATIQILASGGCYGSYGKVGAPIPLGPFSLAGTFTQLTGAYPGMIQYDAQFSGSVAGNQMVITITVPTLQESFGPFDLTFGVQSSWQPCRYPAASSDPRPVALPRQFKTDIEFVKEAQCPIARD